MIVGAVLRRLRGNRQGSTIVEFAIVAPVMLMLIMGMSELMYQTYVQAILNGTIQKAGRDSAIQGSVENAAAIDDSVKRAIRDVAKTAVIPKPVRKSYGSYSIIKPETYNDDNHNNVHDAGECFQDVNGNGRWDADPSNAGQGGASDVTKYTVTVTYPRLFPVWNLFGWSRTQTISAFTLLKNQPYASQVQIMPATVCA